jgi:hypothetical protein
MGKTGALLDMAIADEMKVAALGKDGGFIIH